VLERRGDVAARMMRAHLATTANELAGRLGAAPLFPVAP
jgi:hypothetical protein